MLFILSIINTSLIQSLHIIAIIIIVITVISSYLWLKGEAFSC